MKPPTSTMAKKRPSQEPNRGRSAGRRSPSGRHATGRHCRTGRKRTGAGGIRIGEPPVGHVEELGAILVPEGAQLRHAARRSADPRQPGPGRDVLDAGRSERGQVAAHRLVRLGRATDPAPQPRLRGRQRRPPAAAPQATRRHLDERDQVRDGVGEGIGVGIGPALRQSALSCERVRGSSRAGLGLRRRPRPRRRPQDASRTGSHARTCARRRSAARAAARGSRGR